MKIGVMASGAGTNLQAIIDRAAAGILDVSVEVVLSNRPDAQALARAERHHIPTKVLERKAFPSRSAYDEGLIAVLRDKGCEAVILAGYMLVLTKVFIDAFPMRILNIHPALLPSFPGTNGIGNAFSYGVKLTGPTVHFVNEEVDGGPIVIQAAVPVSPQEEQSTLAERIHRMEHRIFPQAIQWLAQGRLKLEGRRVSLAPSAIPLAAAPENCLIWPPLEQGF